MLLDLEVIQLVPRRSPKAEQDQYDVAAAEDYWTKRLRCTDPLSAVLTYDAPAEANRAYDIWERQTLLRLLKPPVKGKRALDIGCGTGRIALMLAAEGAAVTAVDVSKAMLDYCLRKARRWRVKSRVKCVHSPAHDIPCPSCHFDIITCFGLLEHLPEAIRRSCLAEAVRVLKPTGRLFLVVNNRDNFFLKQKYRLKQQDSRGYFATLVGLDWLKRICRKQNLSLTLQAANPFYGLAHYHLMPHRDLIALSRKDSVALFRLAVELDLQRPLVASLYKRLASHFMVEIADKAPGPSD
jgi:2-polyprenyl-3-methyl-5-hydroxy-6-metoxy-1,4-benzoquinol methylase